MHNEEEDVLETPPSNDQKEEALDFQDYSVELGDEHDLDQNEYV